MYGEPKGTNKKSKNKIFNHHTHIPGKSRMLNGLDMMRLFFFSCDDITSLNNKNKKKKKRKTDLIYFNSLTSLNHNAEEPKPGA